MDKFIWSARCSFPRGYRVSTLGLGVHQPGDITRYEVQTVQSRSFFKGLRALHTGTNRNNVVNIWINLRFTLLRFKKNT